MRVKSGGEPRRLINNATSPPGNLQFPGGKVTFVHFKRADIAHRAKWAGLPALIDSWACA
jgi:hypothetical protein